MDPGGIDAVFIILSVFGGVSGLIAACGWAKAERVRGERRSNQQIAGDSVVLTELQALKQQLAEMHSTSHQFDISFDEALSRMEDRVSRLETKSAVSTSIATETPNTLRNGQSQ